MMMMTMMIEIKYVGTFEPRFCHAKIYSYSMITLNVPCIDIFQRIERKASTSLRKYSLVGEQGETQLRDTVT